MSIFVLDSISAYQLVPRLTKLTEVLKTGIGLVSIEPAEVNLTGINLLDQNSFTIPSGYHFSVGPEGEIMVLIDEKLRSTAERLYDFSTVMDFKTAYAIAKAQRINVAPRHAAYLGLGLLTFHNPRKLIPQIRWVRSKGRGRMGILNFSGKMTKPSWYNPAQGMGSAVQSFGRGDALFVNDITQEVYVINKKAQLQWASVSTGQLIEPNTMPLLNESMLADCIVSSHKSEAEAQFYAEKLSTEQRAQM